MKGDAWDDIFNDFARQVYEAQGKGKKVDRKLYQQTASKLAGNLIDGGKKQEYSYDAPENLTRAKLIRNLYAFSAAKSLSQYKDFAEKLYDADGKIKPFSQYREEVSKINVLYNETWLRTEYDTALAAIEAAEKWDEIMANRDVAGCLEYVTMEDEKVRDEHRALHGITRPVGDPFWKQYYPPNGWNCRCKVTQKPCDGNQTPDDQALTERKKNAHVKPYFKKNVGMTKEVFDTDRSAYAINAGVKALTQLDAVKHYNLPDWSAVHSHMEHYAPPSPTALTKDQYYTWWDSMVKEHGIPHTENFAIPDKQGTKLLFDAHPNRNQGNYFREHVSDRYAYASQLQQVIQKPDEMWSHEDKSRKTPKLTHTYLKYYQDKILVVVAQEKGGIMRAQTIFHLTQEDTFINLRKGILQHANKKF